MKNPTFRFAPLLAILALAASPAGAQPKEAKKPVVTLETSLGNIVLELDAEKAPISVANFLAYVDSGFYDGTIFHRVIRDFMIQGGCPQGTGTGGPGYQFADEINPNKLVRGVLAMANAGPNTNGSQFFIVTAEATPWLDGAHTGFGRVIGGEEVLDAIGTTPTGRGDRPREEQRIITIRIEEGAS
jgi:cyclophilin family peptidyl-prolyl cis-trans isomerase